MVDKPERIVVMGEIAGPYGVRGWLKVRSFTESPAALLDYVDWWLKPKRGSAWKKLASAVALAGLAFVEL